MTASYLSAASKQNEAFSISEESEALTQLSSELVKRSKQMRAAMSEYLYPPVCIANRRFFLTDRISVDTEAGIQNLAELTAFQFLF